ncbi:MAG TPA: DUF1592 domain-containing protein [Woeseiaceae bacterium]|nr:DUF1592 domain-containing protein [Woeseiaceae bacterium]
MAAVALTTGCEQFGFGSSPPIAQVGERWGMVDKYCTDCHNGLELAGNVAFDEFGPQDVAEKPELFERVVRKLRGRLMPPPTQQQPDDDELYAFVAAVERTLDEAAAANPRSEVMGLHRLNRREYANAVRDLLALEIDPVGLLPQDEKVEGYDVIASALQVSPSFIEQYVISARLVALQAVGRPNARAGSQTYNAGPGRQLTHVAGLPLGTRGGILAEHMFPSDGEYEVNVADVIGGLWGSDMEFENTLVVTLDGKLVHQVVVGGEEDMKRFDQIHNGALDAINVRLKNIRFKATAGPHKLGVAFRHRTFAESDDRIQMHVPGGGQDRVFRISSFQVSGPFEPSGLSPTPSREKIFTCYPTRADEQQLCAEEIISSIGSRAFRRPLTETDVTELLQYYQDGLQVGGFEEGIRSALTGILASPYFLYRGERVPQNLSAGTQYKIDDLELASKLSFFFWNTIPDQELLDLAAGGKLKNEAVLREQIKRMLTDPRAATLGSNFVYQWLDMQRLDEVEPDRAVFPYASGSADPRKDFITELALFAQSIFDEDRSVVDLLTADHTYVNERLALHYGIRSVKGERFQRVKLEESPRWGLLGKGAVLMAAAYPNRTSPVLRGAFILKHISGAPLPAPPAEVPLLVEQETTSATFVTVRAQMEAHRTDPVCASCHSVMDPLGFALENFDAVGAWRDRDRFAAGTAPLDTSAQLPDGTEIQGPDDLREALVKRPEQFVQTFAEGLLTYALGRTLDYHDMPTVRKIVREAARDDYRFSSVVWAIVTSEPFQLRQVPVTNAAEVTAQNVSGQ